MLDPLGAEAEVPFLAEPIGYATPVGGRMPASHLVIGVLSLVIACGSVLFSGYTGVVSWVIVRFSGTFAATPLRGPAIVPRALTPAETAAVLARLTTVGVPSPLNAAQTATFTTMLGAPGQQLVAPPSGPGSVPLAGQSITAFPQGNGQVMISCSCAPNGSMLVLDAAGKLVRLNITTFSPTGTVTTTSRTPSGSATTTSSGGSFKMPTGRFSPAVVLMVTSAVHLLLAVLLLVAATLLLARRRLGVRLMRVYAWIKMPAAVVAGGATIWLFRTIGSGRFTTPGLVAMQAAPAVVSMAYAVVILAVLREGTTAAAA